MHKIYISYSSSDNTFLLNRQQGWVCLFQDSLLKMYEQVFGEKLICISPDNKNLTAGDLAEVDVFICVLSPEYVTDKKCLQEVEWFIQASGSEKELSSEKYICKKYISKIVKQPVAQEMQPAALRNLLNYNFFPAFSSNQAAEKDFAEWMSSGEYQLKLADVVYDLHEILQQAQLIIDPTLHYMHPVSRETIYLAETGPDLLFQRQIIKRELQKHGYKVLPEQKLPSALTEIETIVRKDLEASRLSIHLIGNSDGEIPEGTEQSIVEIQNKFAAEYNLILVANKGAGEKDPAFSQLIWMAPELDKLSGTHKELIERIKHNPQSQFRTEILQTPLQDLRKAIGGRFVLDAEIITKTGNISESGLPEIYLIYDKSDSHHVLPVVQLFQSYGLTVKLPVLEGDILDIRKSHLSNLASFDIAVIYRKQANEQWLRVKLSDLLKAPAYGRKKQILDKVIITDESTVTDSAYYESYGCTVVKDALTYASMLSKSLNVKIKKQEWTK